MGFTLVRLPNEPIIIINFKLPLSDDLDAPARIAAEAHRILEEADGVLYSIVNIGDQDLAFSDILLYISTQHEGRAGSTQDVRVRLIAVGTHPLLQTGIKRFQREFSITIPLFTTVDDAVAHARAQINPSSATPDAPTPPEPDVDPPPA